MAKLDFHKVNALPVTPDPNAIYIVDKGTTAEMYVTDISGVAHGVSSADIINSVIDARRGAANGVASLDGAGKIPAGQLPFTLSDATNFLIVADISARDNLSPATNALVLVLNASADATVTSGNAMYAWDATNTTYSKVTEFESLDVTWDAIAGKPNVTAVQIETAVAQSHTHANKTTLDKFGEDGVGDATYDGDPIMQWKTSQW